MENKKGATAPVLNLDKGIKSFLKRFNAFLKEHDDYFQYLKNKYPENDLDLDLNISETSSIMKTNNIFESFINEMGSEDPEKRVITEDFTIDVNNFMFENLNISVTIHETHIKLNKKVIKDEEGMLKKVEDLMKRKGRIPKLNNMAIQMKKNLQKNREKLMLQELNLAALKMSLPK